MPHAKEHPLAGRVVEPDAESGERIYVLGWLDRLSIDMRGSLLGATCADQAMRLIQERGWHASGLVLARSTDGLTLVHHAELPSYDPEPVGFIS